MVFGTWKVSAISSACTSSIAENQPLERVGAEMQPDSARYFPPNLIVSLFHRCFYSHSSVAKRNIFHPFRPPPEDRKKKNTPFFDHLRQNDSKPFLSRYHNVSSTGEFPDRTDQELSGDEITSSVRSINEHAQHSYSHVIRIYRRSFRRAGSGG